MNTDARTVPATSLSAMQATALMLDRFEEAEQLIRTAVTADLRGEIADAMATEVALSHLLAVRGDQAEVWQRTNRVLAFAIPSGEQPLAARARWARGLAALSVGDPEAALHEYRQGASDDAAVAAWTVADLAEAAVAIGRRDVAAAACARACPERYGVPPRVRYRAAALLAGEAEAEQLYLAALHRADTLAMPLTDARARFVYGTWLARRHRVAAARSQFARAREAFAELGADGLAHRTAAALEAVGAAEDAGRNRYGLTPRERQVAQLAAQGLPNPEIGWRLGISRRTVATHLGNLFHKVGVTSRSQLNDLNLSGAKTTERAGRR